LNTTTKYIFRNDWETYILVCDISHTIWLKAYLLMQIITDIPSIVNIVYQLGNSD